MKIFHENLPEEAEHIRKSIKNVYSIDARIFDRELDNLFIGIPKFGGDCFLPSPTHDKKVNEPLDDPSLDLILTSRDLYGRMDNKDSDWGFALSYHPKMKIFVSTLRLKGTDSSPTKNLQVPPNVYLARLGLMGVHEVGHIVLRNPAHFQEAFYVDDKGGELPLGKHCIDNRCVMYEVIDVSTPEAGYMRLGGKKVYDATINGVLDRICPDWLCRQCKDSVSIKAEYFV